MGRALFAATEARRTRPRRAVPRAGGAAVQQVPALLLVRVCERALRAVMSDSALGPGGPLQDLERRPAVWHHVLGQRRRSGFPGLKYDGH